jgi:hypothetical protein
MTPALDNVRTKGEAMHPHKHEHAAAGSFFLVSRTL